MAVDDEILLKLVIQGQTPSEMERLAQSTQGELNARIKVYLDQLEALHKGSLEAKNADIANQIKDEIKARQSQLAAVTQIVAAQTAAANKEAKAQAKAAQDRADAEAKAYKQTMADALASFEYTMRLAERQEAEDAKAKAAAEKAAAKLAQAEQDASKRAGTAWRRTMEDLENFTVVMMGAISVAERIFMAFKKYGEEIDKLTNAYGSLTGSISEMRDATLGEVADIDLITTKNRAFQKDLSLTDEQFGMVAAAADRFADSLMLNTKDSLDAIIDGLATGRVKMLQHAGVVIDTEKVYRDYGKSVGVAADKLSDHAKRVALIQYTLKAMDEKLVQSGGAMNDFSHQWERTTAILQNTWDKIALGVGRLVVEIIQAFTIDIPNAVKIGFAKFKDLIPGQDGHFEDQARAAYGAELEKFNDANGAAKQIEAAKARLAGNGDAYKYVDNSTSPNKKALSSEAAEAARKKLEDDAQFYDVFIRKLGGFDKDNAPGQYDPSVNAHPLLNELGFSDVVSSDSATAEYKDQTLNALLNKATGAKPEGGESLDQQVEKFKKEFIDPLKEKTAAYESELEATKERAGGGLFSVLLFGRDGPDKTYKEMDALQQATVDMSGVIAETMHKMAEQVGAEMANWIANTQGAKKSFRDMTNELLVALSTKAFVKGLEELAEAAGSYASYDYAGAAGHMEAAAAWGALGIAAGLGARAVGHSTAATGASGGGTGGGLVARTGGGVGSSTGSSTASGPSGPLTINLTVLPGGEAEAGRAINKALDAYYAQTGKGRKAA